MPDRGRNVDHAVVKLYIDISKRNFYNNERVKNNCR